MTLLETVSILFSAALTVSFVRNLRGGTLARDYKALRSLRGWAWVPALLGSWVTLAAILATGILLVTALPQVMGFSWLQLLATPEEAPSAGQNLALGGLRIPWFAWVFWALLMVNVPRLAMNEEIAFRKGHRGCRAVIWQSLKFGLAHCLVGIPLGFGFALTLGGLWFAANYLRGGLRRAAAVHTLYNWTVLGLAALWLAGVL
ncbi:MAG: hypothetical protein KIT11_07770 [Fimbriimonadaceae bacterium]|nr:hypothetical protein [Fimbriimonadaceae bacterium]QYK56252.1 MAG: hypothetical protein KF733_01965 [Fimbriimonadaceae bacterium]